MLAGLALLAVAAWGMLASRPRLPSAGPAPAWVKPVAARPAQGGSRSAAALGPASVLPAVLPVGAQSVTIPSLRVSPSAVPVSAANGTLGVPTDEAQVGWWMPSTSELVIDGHVDMEGAGPGALYEVRNLRPGAQVVVQTANGPEHWTINGVRTYTKGRLPSELFRYSGASPRLVLITCGGPFDAATHHYADNVVAYGSPSRG